MWEIANMRENFVLTINKIYDLISFFDRWIIISNIKYKLLGNQQHSDNSPGTGCYKLAGYRRLKKRMMAQERHPAMLSSMKQLSGKVSKRFHSVFNMDIWFPPFWFFVLCILHYIRKSQKWQWGNHSGNTPSGLL